MRYFIFMRRGGHILLRKKFKRYDFVNSTNIIFCARLTNSTRPKPPIPNVARTSKSSNSTKSNSLGILLPGDEESKREKELPSLQ